MFREFRISMELMALRATKLARHHFGGIMFEGKKNFSNNSEIQLPNLPLSVTPVISPHFQQFREKKHLIVPRYRNTRLSVVFVYRLWRLRNLPSQHPMRILTIKLIIRKVLRGLREIR